MIDSPLFFDPRRGRDREEREGERERVMLTWTNTKK